MIIQSSRSLEKLCSGMFDTTCNVFLALMQCRYYYYLQWDIPVLLNCSITGFFSHIFLTFSELHEQRQPALLGSFRRALETGCLWLCPSRNWEHRYWNYLVPYYVCSYPIFQSFQKKKPNETHKCWWEKEALCRMRTCHIPLELLPCCPLYPAKRSPPCGNLCEKFIEG